MERQGKQQIRRKVVTITLIDSDNLRDKLIGIQFRSGKARKFWKDGDTPQIGEGELAISETKKTGTLKKQSWCSLRFIKNARNARNPSPFLTFLVFF